MIVIKLSSCSLEIVDNKRGRYKYFVAQVSAPTKNKCQCHILPQTGGNKRGCEGESDGSVEVSSRTHQPPALPPRPPPRPTRCYETTTANQCKQYDFMHALII